MSPVRRIESPCVHVCAVEGRSGYCIGCRRSLKEIAQWASFSEEQRAEIMRQLPQRRLASEQPAGI